MSPDGTTWIKVPTQGHNGNEETLCVSNGRFKAPDGLAFKSDFVGVDEQTALLDDLKTRKFDKEGFDQQRRVLRYSFVDKSENIEIPNGLVELRTRLAAATGRTATHVSVEEYTVMKTSRTCAYFSNRTPTTFESSVVGSKEDFVAQIPLGKNAIQHVNKPSKRMASCWELESEDHSTDIRMSAGSLLMKSDDFLWNWRKIVSADPADNDSPVITIKFHTLIDEGVAGANNDSSDIFGYIPSEPCTKLRGPIPPLEELLTIVVTTSPIKSNPSTELLERTMETFINCGTDFACKCRKVIICDGYRVDEKDTKVKKYANPKQSMRNGIVDQTQEQNYLEFKEALKKLCEDAKSTDPFVNTVVEELDSRHGYGFALRHALRHCVSTPFVCVIQHDRTFMRPTPMRETLNAMWNHTHIKYVGMSMRSNLTYRDLFLEKYGRTYSSQLGSSIVRPPELLVSSEEYGPNSHSTRNLECSDRLRQNIEQLAKAYVGKVQHTSEVAHWQQQQSLPPVGKHQMSLTPTLFWYDNVHVCETTHYRDFIFDEKYKMVVRGGFVEDKLSPVLKRTVERLGFREGHARFGCYLLDDHSGMFFTGHLDGGSYVTEDLQQALKESGKKM